MNLFKEIDDFQERASEGHCSSNSSCSEFLDTTLEAYESQVVINSGRQSTRSSELLQIQSIFSSITDDNDSFDCSISLKTIDGDRRTTLMIRNIPLTYSRDTLSQEIDHKFAGKYDYLNLPYDFHSNYNVGYAFINLKNKISLREFYNHFNGRQWNHSSIKPCYLRYAKVQQKKKLILKPIKPQIYSQQSSLIQLVQSQKLQCNHQKP